MKDITKIRRRKRTPEDCWEAVIHNPENIKHVPEKHQSVAMWKCVLERSGRYITYCKFHRQTKELVDIAFQKNPEIVRIVNPKHVTREMCETVVKLYEAGLEIIPMKYVDEEMCILAVQHYKSSINYINTKKFPITELVWRLMYE